MRNTILALVLSMPVLAHAAPEDIFGIPSKTYCLKDVCIGDALSDHEAKFQRKPKRLEVPDCKEESFRFGTNKASDGSSYSITFQAVPSMAGSNYSEYYRVSSVTYHYGKDLPQGSQEELAESLGKRMNMAHRRSDIYRTDRSVSLKNEAQIKLQTISINASLTASPSKTWRAEINAQTSCKGQAPKI